MDAAEPKAGTDATSQDHPAPYDGDGAGESVDATGVGTPFIPSSPSVSCDPDAALPADDACAPSWLGPGTVIYPCGVPSWDAAAGCRPVCMGCSYNTCNARQPSGDPVEADGGSAGPILFYCATTFTGRRPAGLARVTSAPDRSLGEVLARAAHLEAASVHAFLDLADELAMHGAPSRLVRRLQRAASDEVRHARDMTSLARSRGAEPPPVCVLPHSARTLLDIAIENEREGCVRETWGAACAVAQAERATDADIRAAMRGIASDEIRHAALSRDLGTWLASRIGPAGRERVARERARAIAEVERELRAQVPGAWRRALGMPSIQESESILVAMRATVWAEA